MNPRFMSESDDLDLSRFRTRNNIPEPRSAKTQVHQFSGKTYKPFKCTKPLDSDSDSDSDKEETCKTHKHKCLSK